MFFVSGFPDDPKLLTKSKLLKMKQNKIISNFSEEEMTSFIIQILSPMACGR